MKMIIKNGLILFAITIISGTLLGLTYEVTKEPIAAAQAEKQENALQNVFANGSFEEEVMVENPEQYPFISNVFVASQSGEIKGYAFKMISNEGYGGNLEFVIGMSLDGFITGIDIIKHAETPGLGAKVSEDAFKDQFQNKEIALLKVTKSPAVNDNEIEAISAATITSKAVTDAVNQAIDFYNNQLKEGN